MDGRNGLGLSPTGINGLKKVGVSLQMVNGDEGTQVPNQAHHQHHFTRNIYTVATIINLQCFTCTLYLRQPDVYVVLCWPIKICMWFRWLKLTQLNCHFWLRNIWMYQKVTIHLNCHLWNNNYTTSFTTVGWTILNFMLANDCYSREVLVCRRTSMWLDSPLAPTYRYNKWPDSSGIYQS